MKVEIYGTSTCRHCKQAKGICEANNIEYTYTDVSNEIKAQKLSTRLGYKVTSVPQIFVNGEHLQKGYETLRERVLSL